MRCSVSLAAALTDAPAAVDEAAAEVAAAGLDAVVWRFTTARVVAAAAVTVMVVVELTPVAAAAVVRPRGAQSYRLVMVVVVAQVVRVWYRVTVASYGSVRHEYSVRVLTPEPVHVRMV